MKQQLGECSTIFKKFIDSDNINVKLVLGEHNTLTAHPLMLSLDMRQVGDSQAHFSPGCSLRAVLALCAGDCIIS